MNALGPVSAALEADLRWQARQHGILVWLDKEGAYTAFADRLRDRGVTEAFPSRCTACAPAILRRTHTQVH
jgi:hypothetical protein